jgi:hypothetical protein
VVVAAIALVDMDATDLDPSQALQFGKVWPSNGLPCRALACRQTGRLWAWWLGS